MGRLIVGSLLVGVGVLATAYVLWACLPSPGCIVGEAEMIFFLMALSSLLAGLFFLITSRQREGK